MTKRNYPHTPISATLTAGSDTRDAWPVAFGDELGRTLFLFASLKNRDAFTTAYPLRLYKSWCFVKDNGSGEPVWFEWDGVMEDGSDGTWSPLNIKEDAEGGLTFANSDGSTTSGVQVVALKGLELQGNAEEGFTLVATSTGTTFKVGPNLEMQPSDNGENVLSVKPGTFELRKTPGYLAYMQYPELVMGKAKKGMPYRKGTLWADMIKVSPEGMLEIDRKNKAIGLQETDGKDPNVSGGSKFLIWPFIYLEGNAPGDGYVELVWYDKTTNKIALDVDGHPLAVRRYYKRGDELTPKHNPFMFAQVMDAKGLELYGLTIIDSFDEYIKVQDYVNGPSGLCIQELSSDGSSSEALLRAEVDTGFSVRVESYYLGSYLAGINYMTSIDEKPATVSAGSIFKTVAGIEGYTLTDTVWAVEQGMVKVRDANGQIADFYIGLELDNSLTRMVAGKAIVANLALIDKNSGWNIGFFTYNGDMSKRPPIYSKRSNGSIVVNKGWTEWHAGFISEDAVSDLHSASDTGLVPKDADFVMVAIYPTTAQAPCSLNLKSFHIDALNPESLFAVNEIKLQGLQHLDFMGKTVRMIQTCKPGYTLRYTLNDGAEGSPMPLGEPEHALNYLTLDKSLNVINGSQAEGGEGALVATGEVSVTVWQVWQLYNEQPIAHEATFWLMVYRDGLGQSEEVPMSRTTFTVDSKRPGVDYFTTNKVKVDLQPGDYIYARGSSDIADGAYAQTGHTSKPLCTTYIEEKYLG